MKLLITFMALLFCSSLHAQKAKLPYDARLADSLHADDNGMKMYVMVILKTGPAQITDKALRDSLFKGHFSNINRMAEEGKLVVAGPFEKNEQQFRGLFILDVKTIEEARSLVNRDATVQQGIFDADYLFWYGSAALPLYAPYHSAVSKKNH